MMDLDQGWRTGRLDLEPLAAGHAAELAPGRGYAREAAGSLVTRLAADGWTVLAHIHPGHLASQRVAAAAGLAPTSAVHNGEVCWIRSKTESPNQPGNRHS